MALVTSASTAAKASAARNLRTRYPPPLAAGTPSSLLVLSSIRPQILYLNFMSIPAEKLAEALALPKEDRAFLAHHLLASLDGEIDEDAEKEWIEVITRRSKEIDEGKVQLQPLETALEEIEAEIHALRKSS